MTPDRRRPRRVVCIIKHDHANRSSVPTARELALIHKLLHSVICCHSSIFIDDQGSACIVLDRVDAMATLCHLRHLDHAKRVHHVLTATVVVMNLTIWGGEEHLVAIRVLVDSLLLTIVPIAYCIWLLRHWWFALIVNELKLVAGSSPLEVPLLWPLLLVLLDAVATGGEVYLVVVGREASAVACFH